jgi:hypothetical protein
MSAYERPGDYVAGRAAVKVTVDMMAAAYQRYLTGVSDTVGRFIASSWQRLPDMSSETAARWAATVGPVVEAMQGAVAGATDAYVMHVLGQEPRGVNLDAYRSKMLRSVEWQELWTRPPREVWNALGLGKPYPVAMNLGLERAQKLASTNLQLAHTHAFRDAYRRGLGRKGGYVAGFTASSAGLGVATGVAQGAAEVVVEHAVESAVVGGIVLAATAGEEVERRRYRRRTRAQSCELCVGASHGTYASDDLMPIHQGCHCVAVPTTRGSKPPPRPAGQTKGAEVEVHEHDELGPVLTKKGEGLSPPKPVKSEARIERQAEAVEEAEPTPNTGQTKETA